MSIAVRDHGKAVFGARRGRNRRPRGWGLQCGCTSRFHHRHRRFYHSLCTEAAEIDPSAAGGLSAAGDGLSASSDGLSAAESIPFAVTAPAAVTLFRRLPDHQLRDVRWVIRGEQEVDFCIFFLVQDDFSLYRTAVAGDAEEEAPPGLREDEEETRDVATFQSVSVTALGLSARIGCGSPGNSPRARPKFYVCRVACLAGWLELFCSSQRKTSGVSGMFFL